MKKLLIVSMLLPLGCDFPFGDSQKEDPHAKVGENQDAGQGKHDAREEHRDKNGEHPGEVAGGTVRLSPSALKKSGVVVGKAGEGVLQDALDVPAEVQLPPDRVAHVSPLVDGQLLDVRVAVGAQVKPGQALATLRSVALGRARAELTRTTSLRDVAKQTLERQEKLRAEGISSERSYLDAKSAYDQANAERGAALSGLSVFGANVGYGPDMTLVSPIEGTVVERHATQGENVSPGDALFVVANTSKVWVIGQAYERQLARVVPDMKATVTLTAFPSKSWEGKVDYIGATLSEGTRTLPIRVEIDNKEGLLRPGLFGNLQLFPGDAAGSGVVLPLTAVQELNGNSIVFVPEGEEGVFSTQPITLGRENKAQVEVLRGLKAGSAVVIDGGFVLKSELVRSQLGHGHDH